MNQENQSISWKRIAQNMSSILLMLLGIVSAFSPLGSSGYVYPIWSGLMVIAGAIIGLFFILKRDLAKKGRPSALAVIACTCWAAMTVAILLFQFVPEFYGYDLEILFKAMVAISLTGLFGIVFTIIALIR